MSRSKGWLQNRIAFEAGCRAFCRWGFSPRDCEQVLILCHGPYLHQLWACQQASSCHLDAGLEWNNQGNASRLLQTTGEDTPSSFKSWSSEIHNSIQDRCSYQLAIVAVRSHSQSLPSWVCNRQVFFGFFIIAPSSLLSGFEDSCVSLYARKILIKANAKELLPRYLRFLVGVADSEDIPLNLSREMLQNDAVIFKIRRALTDRVVRFLVKEMKRDRVNYIDFYSGYSMFFKEGIVMEPDFGVKVMTFNRRIIQVPYISGTDRKTDVIWVVKLQTRGPHKSRWICRKNANWSRYHLLLIQPVTSACRELSLLRDFQEAEQGGHFSFGSGRRTCRCFASKSCFLPSGSNPVVLGPAGHEWIPREEAYVCRGLH